MAATNVTLAQLFGSESKVTATDPQQLSAFQEFSFSGISESVFISGLGSEGWIVRFSGLLRSTTQTTLQLAANNLNSLITTIEGYKRDATLLNVLSGDSTSFKELFRGSSSSYWQGTIIQFESSGRTRTMEGSNIRAIANFTATLRVLRMS